MPFLLALNEPNPLMMGVPAFRLFLLKAALIECALLSSFLLLLELPELTAEEAIGREGKSPSD